MSDILKINGIKASISFDPKTDMYRGEFIDLNGGVDFYSTNKKELIIEGELSLNVFLEACRQEGIDPYKH